MRKLAFTFISFISSVLCGPTAFACDFDDTNGLDVALVLSGGGAKASTQVGVMQIIDEMHIPIHCITGTSMGAVVGSFYAAGYNAHEIGDILTENDWGEAFRGSAPRRDKSFVEKEREENYFSGNIASIEKGRLQIPGGLNSMQGLKTLYRHTLAGIPLASNFDNLGIPFRAVATDLANGDAKIFSEGDLVETILASMAVPGVFAPREIDGSLYVDGGLATNLPIKAAIDMGADIIIALDVTLAPDKPRIDMSIAATAQQITTLFIHRSVQNEIKQLDENDLFLRPNTINVATAAYTRSKEGIAAGRKVGETNKEKLLAIKAKAAPHLIREILYVEPKLSKNVRIINTSLLSDKLIEKRYSYDQAESKNWKIQDRRLRDLAAFGGFGEVDLGHQNGEAVLTISKNLLGRNLIQVGINATSDFGGSSTYGVLGRITHTPLSSSGGDISLSAEFGTNHGLSAELYQPFGPGGRFFVQPELFLRWDRQEFNLFDEKVADFWNRKLGGRARIGRELGKWGVIAIEGEWEKSRTEAIITRSEDIAAVTQKTGSFGVYFAADSLNRNDWPTSGQRLRLQGKKIYDLSLSRHQSNRYEASWLAAFDVADIGVLLNARYGDLSIKNETVRLNDVFRLGGFRQLGGFTDRAIPTNEFNYGSVEIFRRLNKSGTIFELPIYAGAIVELAKFPLDLFEVADEAKAFSGTMYLGADTPIGPLFVGSAYGSGDEFQLFFKIGRTF